MSFEPIFTFQTKDGTKVKYKCNICKSIISASSSSNWGLKRHILSVHKDEEDHFSEILQKNKSEKKITTTKKSDQSDLNKFGFKKQTEEEFQRHKACNVSQESIDTAVFELIMGASLPLTFVRKPEFKNLVNTLQPGKTVMSYKSVRKDMQKSFAEMKENMRKQFSKIDYICTTQDLWTAAKRSWLGMTAHWLDEDLNRVSCVLACYKMKESSTFDVLAQSIHDIYKDFKIQNKVNSGVTDNGANFCKAFRMFSEAPINNDLHNYFPVDRSEDNESDEDELIDEQIQHVDLTEIMRVNNDHLMRPILPSNHYRCAAHTLNLIACADVEAALKTCNFKRILRSTFGKCQVVWNKQNQSNNVAMIIQNKCKMYFKTPCVTRWNSMFDSLERFQILLEKSGDKFHALFDDLGLPYLTDDEIYFIKEYTAVTRPIATALDYLQGEANMYMGHLLPTLKILEKNLLKKEGTLKVCQTLCKVIRSAITRRFHDLDSDESVLLATILLPPRKDLRDFTVDQRAKTKELLVKEVGEIMAEQRAAIVEPTASNNPNPWIEDDEYESYAPRKRPRSDQDPRKLVDEYLNSDNYEISLIKAYPILETLFRKYNSAIPSSAPVERMFSSGGGIFTKTRHCLKDEQFEMALLLKINKKNLGKTSKID